MSDANLDIYDDLEGINLGDDNIKLQEENKNLQDRINKLELDIDKLCKELISMKTIQNNLSENISQLYNTAKCELARKDRNIAELRRDLDDIAFRRVHKRKIIIDDDHESSDKRSKLTDDVLKENMGQIDQVFNKIKDQCRERSGSSSLQSRLDYKQIPDVNKSNNSAIRIKSRSPKRSPTYKSSGKLSLKRSRSPNSRRSRSPISSKRFNSRNDNKMSLGTKRPDLFASRTRNESLSPYSMYKKDSKYTNHNRTKENRGNSPRSKRSPLENELKSRKSRSHSTKRQTSPKHYKNRSKSPRNNYKSPNNIRYRSKSPKSIRNQSKSPSYSRNRSKSPKSVRNRSKSPKYVRNRFKSPKSVRHRSKSPKNRYKSNRHSRSKSPKRMSTHIIRCKSKSPMNWGSKSPEVNKKRSPIYTKNRSRSPTNKSPIRNKRSKSPKNKSGSISPKSLRSKSPKSVKINKSPIISKNNSTKMEELIEINNRSPSPKTINKIEPKLLSNEPCIVVNYKSKKTRVRSMRISDGNVKIETNKDKSPIKNTKLENKSPSSEKESIVCKINKDLYTNCHPILDMTNYRIPRKNKKTSPYKLKRTPIPVVENNEETSENYNKLLEEIVSKPSNRASLEKLKIISPIKQTQKNMVTKIIQKELEDIASKIEFDVNKSIRTGEIRQKSIKIINKKRIHKTSERSDDSKTLKRKSFDKFDLLKTSPFKDDENDNQIDDDVSKEIDNTVISLENKDDSPPNLSEAPKQLIINLQNDLINCDQHNTSNSSFTCTTETNASASLDSSSSDLITQRQIFQLNPENNAATSNVIQLNKSTRRRKRCIIRIN